MFQIIIGYFIFLSWLYNLFRGKIADSIKSQLNNLVSFEFAVDVSSLISSHHLDFGVSAYTVMMSHGCVLHFCAPDLVPGFPPLVTLNQRMALTEPEGCRDFFILKISNKYFDQINVDLRRSN